MPAVELTEILISARQESNRMRHYYIGIEHLFIALLDIQGGLARSILEELGLTPDYASDAIRRKIGKGSQRRLWSGTPSTPRANVVLDIANDLAMEDGRSEVNERDLLTAIIEEADNMPVRVLKSLGVNMTTMHEMARTRAINQQPHQPFVTVDFGQNFNSTLTDDQLLILRRMFYGHARIRVEGQLSGGYTDALLLVITPVHADSREDAPVVVKVADTDTILDEAQRYDRHVKGTLPPLTARLEGRPVTLEISHLAGIAYTIAAEPDSLPRDLRNIAGEMNGEQMAAWLHDQLYAHFARTWWKQRRPFRFQVWTEYDWILPPVLTVQAATAGTSPDHILHVPINRPRLRQIESGAIVALENFTIDRIDHEQQRMRLISGRGNEATKRAYEVTVTNIDPIAGVHFRGEVIDRIIGRVWQTRDEVLFGAVDILEPPFDLRSTYIHLNTPRSRSLVNPLLAYNDLLDFHANGSTSKIHGDLHLGNILIGPNNSPFLIDFAHARDGHTLFDWATLEVSLLNQLVQPASGDTWEDAAQVIATLESMETSVPQPEEVPDLYRPVLAVRAIVGELLAQPGHRDEYLIALALCALRAVSWTTLSPGSRRLMFLVSALAMTQLLAEASGAAGEDQTTPDDSDTA